MRKNLKYLWIFFMLTAITIQFAAMVSQAKEKAKTEWTDQRLKSLNTSGRQEHAGMLGENFDFSDYYVLAVGFPLEKGVTITLVNNPNMKFGMDHCIVTELGKVVWVLDTTNKKFVLLHANRSEAER